MPKRFTAKIGPRDLEILFALDCTPLTTSQLCILSETFNAPFRNEHNLRRRLRKLAQSGLVKSWPYAMVNSGRSPRYFKLTRDGYRLLYGRDARLPQRRYFEEVSHGHHHHQYALAEALVKLAHSGHREGVTVKQFARENSIKLQIGGFTMYPDCAFQLVRSDGRKFHFIVELDNGTERVRTQRDVESIERKLRGYDVHNAQFDAHDPERYLVLFITTRSQQRVTSILNAAAAVTTQPGRTVFLACSLKTLQEANPFQDAIFADHRGLKRTLLPTFKHPLNSKQNVQHLRESMVI